MTDWGDYPGFTDNRPTPPPTPEEEIISVGYFINDLAETIEDTEHTEDTYARWQKTDGWKAELESIAERTADYIWSNCDGWDWAGNGMTLTLVNMETKEILGEFEITVEAVPTFSASMVKPKG